jgi:hypothetical protein
MVSYDKIFNFRASGSIKVEWTDIVTGVDPMPLSYYGNLLPQGSQQLDGENECRLIVYEGNITVEGGPTYKIMLQNQSMSGNHMFIYLLEP